MTKIFFSQSEYIKIRATVGSASHSTFSSNPLLSDGDLNMQNIQVEIKPSIGSLINRMNSYVTHEKKM